MPAEGDVVDVVADGRRTGAVLAEAGERAVDEARVDVAQRLVVDAEALDDAGAKAFEDDVGGLREAVEDVAGGLVAQIEDDAALVASEGVVGARPFQRAGVDDLVGAEGAVQSFGRRFDDDDVGAEVAEEHRAEGAGRQAGEIEDADSFERHRHGGPPSVSGCEAMIGQRRGRCQGRQQGGRWL